MSERGSKPPGIDDTLVEKVIPEAFIPEGESGNHDVDLTLKYTKKRNRSNDAQIFDLNDNPALRRVIEEEKEKFRKEKELRDAKKAEELRLKIANSEVVDPREIVLPPKVRASLNNIYDTTIRRGPNQPNAPEPEQPVGWLKKLRGLFTRS